MESLIEEVHDYMWRGFDDFTICAFLCRDYECKWSDAEIVVQAAHTE
jgi:hypothetical protein